MYSIEDLKPLSEILDRHVGRKGSLLNILQEAQAAYGYIFEDMVDYISERLDIHSSQIFGVATFYAQFYFEPRGRYIIKACSGTACHVKGGHGLIEMVSDKLGIEDGESTEDKLFTLESVACLGACPLAPVVVINDAYYGQMTSDKLDKLIDEYRKKATS